MKRVLIFCGLLLMTVCMACAPAEVTADTQQTAEADVQKAAEAAATPPVFATLTQTLSDVAEHYYPGTAGCSLQAAKYAGTLLDWYAEVRPAQEDVTAAAETFHAALDIDAAAVFNNEQIDGIYAAACELTDETAPDYLDSAGYQPKHYPWAAADIETLFSALYAGCGLVFPG